MSPTRRRVVRAVGPALLATLPGCSFTAGSGTGPEFDTPPPGECEAVEPPTSGPTRGGLEPISYPTSPEEITSETARSFAREYEHAYRRNEFIQRYEDTWYDELDVTVTAAELVEERHGGFVVQIDGTMLFAVSERPETATGTARPAGRGEFTTWYYLADRYALRYANPHADEPDFRYAEVVVCDE